MELNDQVESLRQRHAMLDEHIRREHGRARPDDLALRQMKLEKLYLKEEIDRLTH